MAIPGGIIDCEHVLAAMSRIDKEGVPLVNQSRGVEVQHRDKSYPPKYVLSLAFEVATGSALPLSQFITTEAEYKLRSLGFSVIRTIEPTATIDSLVPVVTDNPLGLKLGQQGTLATATNTVYLVSCVKSKRERPAPAGDLYISTWFTGVRELVERTGSRWFVLSSKYGLVAPDDIIAPYDYTLNAAGVYERRAWAKRVLVQMDQRLPATKKIVLFAGHRYREFLIDYLRRRAVVEMPLDGLTRGEQLAWLAENRSKKAVDGQVDTLNVGLRLRTSNVTYRWSSD